ncbi:hypothetical protein NNJEOMEG_01864 [Fundidesulfovibrio magnetotacticus]|uniref:Uncharacterized protein n=1 Tax=Fundidesulfovibrio magnetotacticus TaxID=2730080 RepID=A0A6V8LW39_9BACT|nr:hypothetical protein [Fundidesulfovibrio magnetotacticus]GFK94026.1 hypothetical protein NNJEOMEG_01864 [Fundidesulfovibrio magnetotacticus]
MAHDADIAQKHLIKETRDSYEFNKIFNRLQVMMDQMHALEQSLSEIKKDVESIKGAIGSK